MKILILHILKAVGLFYFCRHWIANKTLILAYHGFEVDDETKFDAQLFIKSRTLERRLNYLNKHCHVIPLDKIGSTDPRKNKVIVTIDDGWSSTLSVAAAVFYRHQLPYTVYLTTQNVLDNQPIFHIALPYILRHSLGKRLIYNDDTGLKLDFVITIENIADICHTVKPIKRQNNDTALLIKLAKVLDFDFDKVINNRALTLMSVEQVKKIKALGANIELHTHTHNTPLTSFDLFAEEINVNRSHIIDITGDVPSHHCYPSSVYNENSFGYLQRLKVKTATTCYPGFCDKDSNPMELPRFLDGENIAQIIFEAEVCGVLELFRRLRQIIVKNLSGSSKYLASMRHE